MRLTLEEISSQGNRETAIPKEILTIAKVKAVNDETLTLCGIEDGKKEIEATVNSIDLDEGGIQGSKVRVLLRKGGEKRNDQDLVVEAIKQVKNFNLKYWKDILEKERQIDRVISKH